MRRQRSAALLAALSIIIVSTFSGALSASAAQLPAPTITTVTTPTMAATQLLGGDVYAVSATWDTVVEVYSTLDPYTPACTDTVAWAQLPGGWGCNVTLVDGYNSFYAISYEDDGEPDEFSSPSNTVVVARGGTQPPTIDSPISGDTTDDSTPVFSGTGPVLGSIVVNGGPSSPACSATVDDAGAWSCEATTPIPPDLYGNFQAAATWQDGSAGGFSAFVALTVAPPEPTMSYSLGRAGVTATAAGEPTSGVSVELYSVNDNGEGYDYTIVSGCPTLIDTLPVGHERAYGGASVSCAFTGLAPGIWNVYTNQVVDGIYSENRNDFFRVPTTPTLAARVNADRSVTFSGAGQAGALIHVQTPGGYEACQTTVAATTWSCTASPSAGRHSYLAFAEDQGFAAVTGGEPADLSMQGLSAASTTVSVSVPAAPAPAAVPSPTPRPWSVSLGGSTEYRPGDTVTVEGTDAPAGATIDVELHSTPVLLGTTTADEAGAFALTATIPLDTQPGEHHIVVIATPADGSAPVELDQPVTVVVDPTVVDESTEATAAAPRPVSQRQQPGGMSALSGGFVSPAEILSNPLALVTAGSLGLALVLLVLVPAEFFGEAFANHYGSVSGFFARRRGLKRVVEGLGEWIEQNRFWAGAALVFVTSIVFCFVDPGFGVDLTSLRLLLSCAVSILLVNFLSAGVTERIAEKLWKVPTRLEVMPWGLAIAIVGVVVSRILDFSPGFLIGSIIGVGVIGEVSKRLGARVILLWAGVVWAVAMLSWILAPLVPTPASTDPLAFITGLVSDSLVATSAAGLTALLVALLPIALFDGGELFAFSKLRWALAFGVSVASFSIVVLPSASNWLGLGDGLLTWLLLTLGFIAVAIVTYLLALRRHSRARVLPTSEQQP
jgi:hypothetical protein